MGMTSGVGDGGRGGGVRKEGRAGLDPNLEECSQVLRDGQPRKKKTDSPGRKRRGACVGLDCALLQ